MCTDTVISDRLTLGLIENKYIIIKNIIIPNKYESGL